MICPTQTGVSTDLAVQAFDDFDRNGDFLFSCNSKKLNYVIIRKTYIHTCNHSQSRSRVKMSMSKQTFALMSLSSEILVKIMAHLENISDAINFALSCKTLVYLWKDSYTSEAWITRNECAFVEWMKLNGSLELLYKGQFATCFATFPDDLRRKILEAVMEADWYDEFESLMSEGDMCMITEEYTRMASDKVLFEVVEKKFLDWMRDGQILHGDPWAFPWFMRYDIEIRKEMVDRVCDDAYMMLEHFPMLAVCGDIDILDHVIDYDNDEDEDQLTVDACSGLLASALKLRSAKTINHLIVRADMAVVRDWFKIGIDQMSDVGMNCWLLHSILRA